MASLILGQGIETSEQLCINSEKAIIPKEDYAFNKQQAKNILYRVCYKTDKCHI